MAAPETIRVCWDEFASLCTHRCIDDDNDFICTARPKKRVNKNPQYYEPCCIEVCPVWRKWRAAK